MKYTFTFLLLVFFSMPCSSQCNEELKKYSTGFDNLTANAFSFLDSELKEVRIVGYGEDTHGTAFDAIIYLDKTTKINWADKD